MKRWATITLGFLALTSATAPPGWSASPAVVGVDRFRHDSWTSEDGAPAFINAIAQTPDGFLWLAGDGLTRFDGRTFERIATPAGALATASVTTLFVDRSGRLWVGYGQGAGVALYTDGRLRSVPMPAPPPQINTLFQTADGAIWARWGGLGKRLFRLQGGRWTTMDTLVSLPPGTIGSVAVTPDSAAWMTIAKIGGAFSLLRLPPGGGRIESQPDQIGGPTVAVAPDGGLWSADSSGTREIRQAGGLAPKALRRYSEVPGAQVRRLAFDPSGGVWGATRGEGIFRASGPDNAVTRLGLADGLTADMALTAFADREGNVWIGTNGGLDRYRLVPVSRVRDIPPDLVSGLDLAASHDGSLYGVSRGTLYVSRPNGAPQTLATGLKDMAALCPAARSGIWLV